MVDTKRLPHINTELDTKVEDSSEACYFELVKKILLKILPDRFFELVQNSSSNSGELKEYFRSLMPLTFTSECDQFPCNMSYYILYNYRANAFKFCYEMISRWLVPGKRMNVVLMYAIDFSFPELGDELYTLCEVVLRIESPEEKEELQRNLPIIDSEISLGVVSSFHARRILEIKGLSNDEKTAMIQEYMAYMIKRKPEDFNYDLFQEMQHMLVMCRDEFKKIRDVRQLSRVICVKYLFRKSLFRVLKQFPDKRHLFLKIFKANLRIEKGSKKVMGLIVAVNFLRENEVFEETHLIKAVRNYIPTAQAVPNSFFFNRRGKESICTLYLEIEKIDGCDFSGNEVTLLRRVLPADLEGRVEQLIHPVFMPRNEEEIMRNILTLGNQIKYVRDIPQMFITFDEQANQHLYFTVIIVRVVHENSPSIEDLFAKSQTFIDYVHDRRKSIGALRKKHQKEATVFLAKLPKDHFLRRDHSIDLYKARQAVVSEISDILGKVRDYNGGMISKQSELLNKVRELVKGNKEYNDLLFENFFYSLNPVIMRTVLEPTELKKLFFMFLDSISEGIIEDVGYSMTVRAEPSAVYVVIGTQKVKYEEEVKKTLGRLNLPSTSLASSCIYNYDFPYLGYIYRSDDPAQQRKFCMTLKHSLEECENAVNLNPIDD